MIPNLPGYVSILFGVALVATLLIFNRAARDSLNDPRKFGALLLLEILWLVVQGSLAFRGEYRDHLTALPPRLLVFGVLPALTGIAMAFSTRGGRAFVDGLPLRTLTWLNVIRVPVEVVLFDLYLSRAVPRLMTFEGGNLDIVSGLTAPVVVYLAFRNGRINRGLLLAWNVLCLGLLANIVVRALLSAPFPSQKWAFDQPNLAILTFPFVWLPAVIVPLVLFGHLASLRQLVRLKAPSPHS
jgi:hypothetical protein